MTTTETMPAASVRPSRWQRIGAFFGTTGFAAAVALAAVASGAVTYLTLARVMPFEPTPNVIVALLLTNLSLALALAALVGARLVRLWIARRSGLAGSRLHLRLVSAFSVVAILPPILVAGFAAVTLYLVVDAWFSQRVQTAIGNAVDVADAYLEEHKKTISADVRQLALDVRGWGGAYGYASPLFRNLLFEATLGRKLDAAYLMTSDGRIRESANITVFFLVEVPSPEELARVPQGEAVVLTSEDASQVRAIVRVPGIENLFVLGVRYVDARVLEYQSATQDAAQEYARLRGELSNFQLLFALTYVIVALLILLAAIWLGLAAANRIVAPIGRLIAAAERVREGDWSARVAVTDGDDEFATLARAFNRMTENIGQHRDEQMEATRQIDSRRRFIEAVLSGVSAGVIGLDGLGRITIVNPTAAGLIGGETEELVGHQLVQIAPEMQGLLHQAIAEPGRAVQKQIDVLRSGSLRHLNVRVTAERRDGETRGYVVTFDDITALVSAQRSSAWADVARRIAHEIKNPLTPIQLSAERLRRKYRGEISSDPEIFDQCTGTIIRQVNDIGRMVDEFSSFARMPAPSFRIENVSEIVRQAVFLQKIAHQGIVFDQALPAADVTAEADGRLLAQALTNILKNAAESVSARWGQDETAGQGRIRVRLDDSGPAIVIEVEDNGVGLPQEHRHRLTEPYVTTRAKGTGLGLAIVRKIMEDHGGGLTLEDVSASDTTETPDGAVRGALVRLRLPKVQPARGKETGMTDVEERIAYGA